MMFNTKIKGGNDKDGDSSLSVGNSVRCPNGNGIPNRTDNMSKLAVVIIRQSVRCPNAIDP